MDETTRKFQVTVRVESDEELNDDQWEEVRYNLEESINDQVELDTLDIEHWCGECDAQEDITAYLSISQVNVTLPDPVRAEVIGLPK